MEKTVEWRAAWQLCCHSVVVWPTSCLAASSVHLQVVLTLAARQPLVSSCWAALTRSCWAALTRSCLAARAQYCNMHVLCSRLAPRCCCDPFRSHKFFIRTMAKQLGLGAYFPGAAWYIIVMVIVSSVSSYDSSSTHLSSIISSSSCTVPNTIIVDRPSVDECM